ncbi:MAG: transcription-repair coupling factor [Pseudomonadales bacterium]|nr:transcription-repair coupling factor [Pseudomonadales bacterium]MBO7006394.1 transcription-repair coupling factor [Pseudomonadales bacterium]
MISPSLPVKAADRRRWANLPDAAATHAIAKALSHRKGTDFNGVALVIAADTQGAEQIHQELQFFLGEQQEILHLPDWETLIYDSFSPHQDIISERLTVLNRLATLEKGIVVIPATTLVQRVAPTRFIVGSSLMLKNGQKFDIAKMRRQLQGAAYRSVETVYDHGEYAVRGAIMDIFPMGSDYPLRIDLFDDEIDSLRTFDPETQRSLEQISEISLLPAREFPLTETAINDFQNHWFQKFPGDARECPVYRDVSQGISPAGIEYYLPLFFEELSTLFDYLPEETLVFCHDIETRLAEHWQEAEDRYENLRYDIQKPILPPQDIILKPDELFALLKNHPRIDIFEEPVDDADEAKGSTNFDYEDLPDVTIKEKNQNPLGDLQKFSEESSTRLLIVAESNGRREVVDELLARHGLQTRVVDDWQTFAAEDLDLAITVAPLERSLATPELALITEQQLFGERVLQKRRRDRERENFAELAIKSLTELSIGAPVVHIDHGVGRYQGLQTLEVDGQKTEFLTLVYQEEAKLYVPVSSLHLISRYTGAEEGLAPLHRLGGETWQKAKRKAAEQVHDVAAELLNIYARREAKKGYSYPQPDSSYHQFARAFPFEETPDQEVAIESVISDMVSDQPMDRLICGDVGFGKTEVAMRAAFIAVQSGKQVAILVPTTLLAQQHTETFKDRFADWPVNIESISRFKTKKEQKAVTDRMKIGQVDIVIGTHALIQEGLDFKNLGLLIIDEEHRFGVRQKEKLKSLRAEVDILTLTATPIPRTLNMAMSGMRDLSIIATPPAKRLSIKTFVRQRNDGLIKEAVQRELMRGGQVYYLHNEVRTIENTAEKLQQLVPQATIAIGHGQMRERELEQVMSDFYHKRANVLVCTTIIETGIDIPNANTIIMDRADKFGLAQIHQLRGRVGRSHHQAYAYLLTPHRQAMTSDAVKRLDAISDAEDLGAGFILATHDLEIRGAGELLGDEQTGNLQTIGYSLYMEMLDRAVKAIQDGKTPNLDRPLKEGTEVNLHLPALIPDDYLPDVHMRLVLYKRISNAESEEQLRELQVEMIDRFGLLPEPVKNLFRITALKLRAEDLGIKKLDAGERGGRIEFDQETTVDAGSIVELVQAEPHRYRLPTANQLAFDDKMEKVEARFSKVERLLERLEKKRVSMENAVAG